MKELLSDIYAIGTTHSPRTHMSSVMGRHNMKNMLSIY